MEAEPTVFEFTSYHFEPEKSRIVFNYKQEFKGREAINYAETVVLPEAPDFAKADRKLVDKILQGIHLMLGISYYKFYASGIVRHHHTITKSEADFWNVIYKNGLGEFYFRNNLNPAGSPKFKFSGKAKAENFRLEKNGKCLIGLSGGKDSIVALELLKERGIDPVTFYVETNKQSEIVDDVIRASGAQSLKVQRFLDPKIFEKHAFNGHIPISAIYAFLGALCSVFYGYQYFIVANERSSNFGNIKYQGLDVNHQWSKSSEFENLFSDYLRNSISPDIGYFSLMRPFYEIRIAKMFTKYEKYFGHFTSCNKNFLLEKKQNSGGLWCGQCPKCAFSFILFSAFLSRKKLLQIFGKNLYTNEALLPLFEDILGLGKIKPFDCVGTFEEARAAFDIANNKFGDDFIALPVRSLWRRRVRHKISKKVFASLFKTSISPNIPNRFKFCGMENAVILGYGKEGQVTERYLGKFYPGVKIGIADAKDGKKYLDKQHNFDIAIKTPGMKKELVKIPYTTATNLFFTHNKNLAAGVTGSKGKSTTASLVYSILKEAGKDVRILGNIGFPMLEALLEPVPAGRIFVAELSSQQLEDMDISPDIAVVTNLFPEHMDYHGSLENYYNAKKNIINFQNKSDAFVYNSKNSILRQWARHAPGKKVKEAGKIPLPEKEIPLLGKHNLQNIKLAVSVAREFEIQDGIIAKAIKNFKALPHRLEFVGEFSGIKFYDDAISTTPESTIMAIKALKNIDTIFLGGQDRGYDFSQLEKIVKKYKIKNIVLFPDSGERIFKSFKGLNVLKTKSMKQAVNFAFCNTEPGKICLLSCASPSYSLWKNFEEKGDLFQAEIKKHSK